MPPRLKTSLRASTRSTAAMACSGGMNAGVPSRLPACVSWSASRAGRIAVPAAVSRTVSGGPPARPRAVKTLARPQSMTWTSPNAPTITLDGFRSRWITSWAWAYATVWQTCSNAATNRPRPWAGAGGQQVVQGAALDQLHGEEGAAVGQGTQVVNRRDARVLQLGGDAGLVGEPAGDGRVGRVAVLEQLDGHVPVEGEVAGLVDDADAAAADLAEQFVPGYLRRVGGGRHGHDRGDTRGRPKAREQLDDGRVDEAELPPPLPEFGEQLGAAAAHLLRRLARVEHLLEQSEHPGVAGHRQSSSRRRGPVGGGRAEVGQPLRQQEPGPVQ